MKTNFPRDLALAAAYELKNALAPFCHRIEIAGSLRRGKPEVGDIELVFVPKMDDRQIDFFTTAPVDTASEKIQSLMSAGELAKRPNVNGDFTWGERNKLAIHVPSGIPVDFFATTQDNWWVTLVIRTGSKETNLSLMTGAQAKNARLNAYGCGVTWNNGTMTQATSEQHVFELCGVPYKEPQFR